MKTAVAYTSDIILGRTCEVISRKNQKELIEKYAAENGIQITAWFEDKMYNEDILSRPGIQDMLTVKDTPIILVERVWSFSRSWVQLQKFYKELESKGMKIEVTTTLWDCISQMSRRHFNPAIKSPKRTIVSREQAGPVKIAKPKRLNFTFDPSLSE